MSLSKIDIEYGLMLGGLFVALWHLVTITSYIINFNLETVFITSLDGIIFAFIAWYIVSKFLLHDDKKDNQLGGTK